MTDPKEVSAIGQIFYEYGGRMAFLVVEDTREPNSSVRVHGMVPGSVPRWNVDRSTLEATQCSAGCSIPGSTASRLTEKPWDLEDSKGRLSKTCRPGCENLC